MRRSFSKMDSVSRPESGVPKKPSVTIASNVFPVRCLLMVCAGQTFQSMRLRSFGLRMSSFTSQAVFSLDPAICPASISEPTMVRSRCKRAASIMTVPPPQNGSNNALFGVAKLTIIRANFGGNMPVFVSRNGRP